jgi:SAM-dependent methyltransferase
MSLWHTRRWAIDQCKQFFGLTDADERLVAGERGADLLLRDWESNPAGHYDNPLQILRQEWWHASVADQAYWSPGFWAALPSWGLVLDWGCGTAELARLPWILRGGVYIGVDVSAPSLAYCQAKYAGHVALFGRPGSVVDDDAFYDGIVCVDVLEHVPNPLEVQAHLWRQLKPGGHMLLKFDDAVPHAGHLEASVAQIPAWWHWLKDRAEIIELEALLWVRKPG